MSKKSSQNSPTHSDAMLLLAVLNAPAGDLARDGMEVLWTFAEPPTLDSLVQLHPVGSLEYQRVMALLTVGERLGTFVKDNVLNQKLTLDLIGVHAIWERCTKLVTDLRVQRHNPKLFENLEWLGTRSPT
ncbi:MAG: DUF4760 domain-containing protein [Acidimicrobiales bacterium]